MSQAPERGVGSCAAGAVLVGLLAACEAPLPNPDRSAIESREVAPVRASDAEPSEPRDAEVLATTEPTIYAEFADGAWIQPIQFDPAGSWWASSSVHSPLWMPRPHPAEGSWPVPPGHQDREQMAAALVISLALIASAFIH